MQLQDKSHRPSEKAESFLRQYLANPKLLPGDRLPTPREIASTLGVSESTVRGVIRKWRRDGRLRSRQGSGVFVSERAPSSAPLRIGINARSEKDGSFFWGDSIRLHVVEAILQLGAQCSFTSLYSATEAIDSLSAQEVNARCQSLNGMILYQSDSHARDIAAYCRMNGIPCVFLNPPTDDSVTNFVSLENFTSFYRVTRALRDCRRKRFAVLINPTLERSVTIRQRLSGTINGLGSALGCSAELRIVDCSGFTEDDGYAATLELWKKEGFQPDAIVTAGDGLALGALTALKELGVRSPDDVALVSGAGFDPRIGERQITTLVHPLREIGSNLVSLLVEMIRSGTVDAPAKILPIDIRCGTTTTREESRELAAIFANVASLKA